VAASTHPPSVAASNKEIAAPIHGRPKPQRPAIRPDGMGRSGSLIASTKRSHQSLIIWLVPHTNGPVSNSPAAKKIQFWDRDAPDEITPQPKAHMGGNHVMGLDRATMSRSAGARTDSDAKIPSDMRKSYAAYFSLSNYLDSYSVNKG
jgi:hypothetical protein